MAHWIEVSGTASFSSPEGLEIHSREVRPGKVEQNSEPSFDEDDICYLWTFQVTKLGNVYRWVVEYTMEFGSGQVSIDEVHHYFPAGTELEEDFEFDVMYEEDHDSIQ